MELLPHQMINVNELLVYSPKTVNNFLKVVIEINIFLLLYLFWHPPID